MLKNFCTMTLGQRIKHLRQEMKLSQTGLAKLADCSQPTIADYENDKVGQHRAVVLMKIASALKTTPEFLANGTGPKLLADAGTSEAELLEAFGKLDSNSQAAIIAAAKAMALK